MSNIKFITDALNAFAKSTSSFYVSFENIDSFRFFLSNFGWELDPNIDETGFIKVHEAFETEITFLEQMNGDDTQRAIAASGLITCLMTNHNPDTSWPTPLNTSLFWSEYPQQILNSIIWNIVKNSSSLVYALLRFGSVFNEVEQDAIESNGDEPLRLSYLNRTIDWEQFVSFLANPENAFKTAYNWNSSTDDFSAKTLLKAIGAMFEMLPVASIVMDVPEDLYEKYYDNSLPTSPEKIEMLSIMPYILRDLNGDPLDLLKISLNAIPIPAEGTNTGPPFGIVIFPIVSGNVQTSYSLGDGITLFLNGNYASSPVNAKILPDSVSIELTGSSEDSLSASAIVEIENETSPWVIIGTSDGPRFEVSKAHVEAALTGTIQHPIFAIKAALDKATVVIDFSSSDGLLKKVFGDSPQCINAELTVGWSSQGGFHISGGAVLDLTIPVHKTLFDTIIIDCVKIKLGTDSEDFKTNFNAGIVACLKLGPITASINNVGIKLGFKPTSDGSGNIGIFDVSLGFLPPKGAGLAIKAGLIEGGGFLDFDNINKRYAGILQLKMGDIGLTAIGLITTKMPDGSDGFSMLVSIGVEFTPAIQLSFGFTLSAVGGLIGINRDMLVDVLRTEIRQHTMDSILFPVDPIRNAPTIISNLRAVFPPEDDRFVVGPMLRVGWGSPTIITAELGFFIALPSPVRIVILGLFSAAFPDEDLALIELHLDVFGAIDFEKKTLAIDACLYNSHVLAMSLSGDAALRLGWGDIPHFGISLGGFHPRFNRPPQFPPLRRLCLSIGSGNNPRLSCEVYLALTSNSFQFGALAELKAEACGCKVHGYLGFDALFYFSPFGFDVSIKAGISISFEGINLMAIRLYLQLAGTTPWHAEGEASFEILWWEIEVHFSKTWGRRDKKELPPVNPWNDFVAALERPESWGTTLPAGREMVESLRSVERAPDEDSNRAANGDGESQAEGTTPLLAHPAGTLEVRQKVLPLDIRLSRYGNAPIGGYHIYSIVPSGTGNNFIVDDLKDYFARGQFEKWSDKDKLSKPSYELLKNGIAFRPVSASFDNEKVQAYDLKYESEYIDDEYITRTADKPDKARLAGSMVRRLLKGAASRNSALRTGGLKKYQRNGIASNVSVFEEGYTIVRSIDMKAETEIEGNDGKMSRMAADQALEDAIKAKPALEQKIQIVPSYEVAA